MSALRIFCEIYMIFLPPSPPPSTHTANTNNLHIPFLTQIQPFMKNAGARSTASILTLQQKELQQKTQASFIESRLRDAQFTLYSQPPSQLCPVDATY